MEFKELSLDLQKKLLKDQVSDLQITISNEFTQIIVIAKNNDSSKNRVNKVSCTRGLPLGGYIYDTISDSYQINCADYINLGTVPISMWLKIAGNEHWKQFVPLSDTVIKKLLNNMQKKELRKFKSHLMDHTFEFIQILESN